jgi:hypothetical protein
VAICGITIGLKKGKEYQTIRSLQFVLYRAILGLFFIAAEVLRNFFYAIVPGQE